jgi:hypothetical protein
MELHQALDLFQNQVVNTNSMWAYYSSATLFVLGFTVASEKATRSRHEISAIQIGYLLFTIGNGLAIYAAQGALVELGVLVKEAGGSVKLASTFTQMQVLLFHGAITTSVLLVIEVTYRFNHKAKKKT